MKECYGENRKKMKKVWVIGANSDVAKALILLLSLDTEYEVVAATRNVKELFDFQEKHAVQRLEIAKMDVTSQADIDAFLLDRDLPDILILAHGVLRTDNHVLDYLEEMVVCNYTSDIKMIESVWTYMLKRKKGCIVGISSVAADRGKASNKLYSSTKAALSSYLQAIMQEGAKNNIQVVDVKPGYIRSKMLKHDAKKYNSCLASEPKEVANAILKKLKKGKSGTVYVKPVWRCIMWFIKVIPERVYVKLRL